MRFGVHCSIRNGLDAAVNEAVNIGCETMQIFSRSPRMWRARTIDRVEAENFKRLLKKQDISPFVIHTPYLPNLCTSDKNLYKKSLRAFQEDIERGAVLGADYLVIHPGAYSPDKDEDEGYMYLHKSLEAVLDIMPKRFTVLLETMAGGGRRLGNSFSRFGELMDKISNPQKIGFCIDTCHLYGSGFDLARKEGLDELVDVIKKTITWKKVKLVHLNDSKAALGSHRDLHQHIGKGFIGKAGFKRFINHSLIRNLPGILETPKDSPSADKNNLKLLRTL